MTSIPFDDSCISRDCIECDGGCGMTNPPKRCQRCKTTFYCGRDCQRKHWVEEHKQYCHSIEFMRQSIAGISNIEVNKTGTATAAGKPCAICLEDDIDRPIVLPDCGHTFCFKCLVEWQNYSNIGLSGRSNCPLCRKETEDLVETTLERVRLMAAQGKCQNNEHIQQEAIDEINNILDVDDHNLQALFTKVEILLDMNNRAHEAHDIACKLSKLNEEGLRFSRKVQTLLEEHDRATARGDATRISQLDIELSEIEDKLRESPSNSKQFRRTTSISVKLLLIKTEEAIQDWSAVKESYMKLMSSNEMLAASPPEQRMVLMGLCRACYETGDYHQCINVGKMALDMNRHFPGVHKYIILAIKATGDLEGAKKTAARAVIYETPWDDDNRREVFKLYQEMMSLDGETDNTNASKHLKGES